MKFIPHTYQAYAIRRVVEEARVGLFLDMGLGKTVITLTAIHELKYNRWSVGRVLVVAPKKVAEATWTNEARQWDHLRRLRIIPVLGSAKARIRALDTPGDVWVINRENVPWLVDYYRDAWPFDMVVLDESSSFKNPQSKRFKALKLVLRRIRRLVELTGTPAPNGLEDLWAQIYLLDGGARLGRTITAFREAFFTQDPAWPGQPYRTYTPQADAEGRIRRAISDICVSMKAEDYLELPGCMEDVIPVALDTRAAAAYQKLERDMLLRVDESTIDAGGAAALANKLLQLCNGAVYDGDRQMVPIHSCKIDAFLETVEGLHKQPALVFYNFQHDLARLEAALAGTGLRVRRLSGAADADAWNQRRVDILLAHPASCAYGLNLQAGGNHVIWFGLTWSLELYQQANKRLHRQGQTEKVIVHHLVVQGGIDEDVIAALRDKGDTQAKLLEALKARVARVHDGTGEENADKQREDGLGDAAGGV